MFHENHIYIVKWEKKQECVQILKICPDCGFMNVSITNVLDKQQQRELGDSYWPANLINRYYYSVWRSVVTYFYVKRDERHVTCSAYYNWLHWKRRFVCLLNLVTDYLSPFYSLVYGIMLGCHNIIMYIRLLCVHAYIHVGGFECVCVCVCVHIYAYICVCVYIYTHTYLHTYIYMSISYLPAKLR